MKRLPIKILFAFLVLVIIFMSGCVQKEPAAKTGNENITNEQLQLPPNISKKIVPPEATPPEIKPKEPEIGKNGYGICTPREEKSKVTAIIAKGGIFDSSAMNAQISKYFDAVKKDLAIENIGLKKFEGKTIGALDIFIENLYAQENVGYIVLIGDDLPTADVTESNSSNLGAIYEKLECVGKKCSAVSCREIAISYILPPVFYSNSEKTDFVLKILDTYTKYHDNFAFYNAKYQKSVLFIKDIQFAAFERNGYGLPMVSVFNTELEKINAELKNKPLVLTLYTHGSESVIKMGLGSDEYTSVNEYTSFVKENGAPALFVDATACQLTTIKKQGITYCCWPQIFMGSGVWAYYTFGGNANEISKMENAFSNENTIGLAIRKNIVAQNFVFGDVLAHLK